GSLCPWRRWCCSGPASAHPAAAATRPSPRPRCVSSCARRYADWHRLASALASVAQKGPANPPCCGRIRTRNPLLYMENPEREGFEPSIPVTRYTAFPVRRPRPTRRSLLRDCIRDLRQAHQITAGPFYPSPLPGIYHLSFIRLRENLPH